MRAEPLHNQNMQIYANVAINISLYIVPTMISHNYIFASYVLY